MEWYTREVNCTTSDLRTKDLGKLALVLRYLNKTKGIGTSYRVVIEMNCVMMS